MKKALSILVVLLIVVPSMTYAERADENHEWTIMIYMGGGYGDRIASAIPYDIQEIERAGYDPRFNIIVLKDGAEYGDSGCMILGEQGFEDIPLNEIDSAWVDEVDMSSPHTLMEFMDWSLNTHPARHSMLILWGHGRGWMGMPNEENYGVMTIEGLSLALGEVVDRHGKLDVVGFDQCNMAMFEVFYQIAPYARYAVASEKEEDMAGWPYDLWLSHVYEMENPDGRNISIQVVMDYVAWATNNSRYSATMSAIDLSEMDGVRDSLLNYTSFIEHFLPYYKEEMAMAREKAESYDREPYPFDLLNLTENIGHILDFPPLSEKMNSLRYSVESAVIMERHHTVESDMSVEGSTGMSIWFPTYGSREEYRELRSYSSGWSDFLDLYLESVPPEKRGFVSLEVERADSDHDGASESFFAEAYGNGSLHLAVCAQSGDIVREVEGSGHVSMNFQWNPGYYGVVAYLMNGTSVESHVAETAVIEKLAVIEGEIYDFMDQPASATIYVRTSLKNLSLHASGHYLIELKAPYDFVPGENVTVSACASGCVEREVSLDSERVDVSFRVVPELHWIPYASALLVFLLAALAYVSLFDSSRTEENMKKFKRRKRMRVKKIKKVIWVKDFIDREKELSVLKEAVERAGEGHGSTIFLTGEEGVGKKSIMEKLRQDSGVKSVFYECKGSQKGRPYESIRKIIDMLHGMGMIDYGSEDVFSTGSKEMLFERVYDAIKEASSKEPVIISIFNAQWLGVPSIDVLGYVARGIDETGTLLVISAPHEELEDIDGKPHPLNAMLMDLIIEGKVRMVRLERFDMERTGEMMEKILGDKVPEETLEKIYEVTRGLPEMIIEMASSIKRSGADISDPESIDFEMPSTVKGLVSRRLSRMDEKERRLAEWAAILGNSFEYELLKELGGMENPDDVFYRLIEDRIINEEEGVYSFDHPEIRNRILEELGDRAVPMHLKAGELLEKKGGSVYSLAYQFCQGGDRKKCLEYSMKAAKEAERSYAPEEAIKHYEMALNLADEESAREIELALAENHLLTVGFHDAMELCKNVIYSEADDIQKERAMEILGRAYLETSMWDDAEEIYSNLVKSKDPRMAIEGYRGLGKIYWRLGRHKEAADIIKKAIELSDKLGDPLLSGSTRIDLANIHSDIGEYARAIELHKKAVEILESAGELRELARAYNNMGEAYRYSGDLESAVESYNRSIEYAERSGDINIKGYGLLNIGTAYAHMGKLDDAKEYLDRAYRIFRKNDNDFIMSGIEMAYGIVYGKEGKWDESEKEFGRAIERLEDIDVKYDLGVAYLEYGRMLKRRGDERYMSMYGRARELFEQVGSEEHIRKIEEETGGGE